VIIHFGFRAVTSSSLHTVTARLEPTWSEVGK